MLVITAQIFKQANSTAMVSPGNVLVVPTKMTKKNNNYYLYAFEIFSKFQKATEFDLTFVN